MKKNQKGYIINATTLLLLIPLSIIGITIINQNNSINETTVHSIHSKTINYQTKDIKQNMNSEIKETLIQTTNKIITTKTPLKNSTEYLINELNRKMKEIYKTKNIIVTITDIKTNPDDSFQIKVQYTIKIEKERIKQEEENTEYIDIEKLSDPIPHLETKQYETLKHDQNTIKYENQLQKYLKNKKLNNTEIYQNATSPYYITKCPYTPYTQHKNKNIIKNCLQNKYYHESKDGACYLCRLEGKSNCPHYGIETFIQPNSIELNNTTINATCSIDHVIFNENSYPGENKTYAEYNNSSYYIILDNAHSKKYGTI